MSWLRDKCRVSFGGTTAIARETLNLYQGIKKGIVWSRNHLSNIRVAGSIPIFRKYPRMSWLRNKCRVSFGETTAIARRNSDSFSRIKHWAMFFVIRHSSKSH